MRYLNARLSSIHLTISASFSGTLCPLSRQYLRILSGMFPAGTNSGASGSIRALNGFASAAICSRCPKLYSFPSRIHCLLLSWISHNPIIFLRKEIFPWHPPSFVIFSRSDNPLITGSSSSVPNSDHVPQLMKMKSLSLAGTAASALCVSCPATAITSAGSIPSSWQIPFFMRPSLVPHGTILPRILFGIPRLSNTSFDHILVRASSICVVDAMEYSLTCAPHR